MSSTRDFRAWAERHGERLIPEREFRAATENRRQQLAEGIRASGLSYTHIANATRVGRMSVSRAAKGVEIRQEAFDRIQYYIGLITPRKVVQTGELTPVPGGLAARQETFEIK
jgi:hypothetical protein